MNFNVLHRFCPDKKSRECKNKSKTSFSYRFLKFILLLNAIDPSMLHGLKEICHEEMPTEIIEIEP